jgi:hypothetical protein
MDTHDELRDELVAVLGATRELSPDTDRELAEAFMRRVERLSALSTRPEQRPVKRNANPLRVARNGFIGLLGFMLLAPLAMATVGVSPDEVLRYIYWNVLPVTYTNIVSLVYVCALVLVAACVVALAYLQRLSMTRAE